MKAAQERDSKQDKEVAAGSRRATVAEMKE
jgi:hypothetical protein